MSDTKFNEVSNFYFHQNYFEEL